MQTEALDTAKAALEIGTKGLFTANNTWMLVATAFVLVMHLGFATLEAGFVQRKNVTNILFKNCMIIAIGILSYWFVGFSLMFPGGDGGGYFGFNGFFLNKPEGAAGLIEYADMGYTYWTDFLFQSMFAATCCTIVSGGVAERIKLAPFLIFCILFVSISYPITGMWKWGSGWLDARGFYDFAGSTLVHSVGGWGALAGIMLLGPRAGKYTKKGIKPIPGHSMPLAVIGVFLLWFGWFGFNGGSVLSGDPELVSLVILTTTLAASAGAVGAFIVSYFMFQSHDLPMTINGILGGLVSITAGADLMSPSEAAVIGFLAGCIIPISITFFDKKKLDDPVGVTSVHLVCGIWGSLAVGFFGIKAGTAQILSQLVGITSVGIFTFLFAYLLFFILMKTVGIRVNKAEEAIGLDIGDHGLQAYSV